MPDAANTPERPAPPANGLDLSARIVPGLFGVDLGIGKTWGGSVTRNLSASMWAETDGGRPTWGALLKLSVGW